MTKKRLGEFTGKLSETCRVDKACEAAGISRQTAYRWRREDPDFAKAWDEALKVGLSALEDEAHRRAFEGVEKPVYQGGEKVGTILEHSDTLAIFLLKAHAPEKYRDNSRIELAAKLAFSKLSDEELDDEIAAAELKLRESEAG